MTVEPVWWLYLIDGALVAARNEHEAVAGWRAMRWRDGEREGVHRATDLEPLSVERHERIDWVAGAKL